MKRYSAMLFLTSILICACTAKKSNAFRVTIHDAQPGDKIVLCTENRDGKPSLAHVRHIFTSEKTAFFNTGITNGYAMLYIERDGKYTTAEPLKIFTEEKQEYNIEGCAGTFDKSRISGGIHGLPEYICIKKLKDSSDSLLAIYNEAAKTGAENASGLFNVFAGYRPRIDSAYKRFIKTYPCHPYSSRIIIDVIGYINVYTTVAEADSLFRSLGGNLKKNPKMRLLDDLLVSMKATAEGAAAHDFSLSAPSGENVSLSSFKGKWVLLDFWASWCLPCRQNNPKMVEIYKKYAPAGLEIISISIDKDRSQWTEAIKEDRLPWTQVIDNENAPNTQKSYAISSIPTLILVSPDGKIVFRGAPGIFRPEKYISTAKPDKNIPARHVNIVF